MRLLVSHFTHLHFYRLIQDNCYIQPGQMLAAQAPDWQFQRSYGWYVMFCLLLLWPPGPQLVILQASEDERHWQWRFWDEPCCQWIWLVWPLFVFLTSSHYLFWIVSFAGITMALLRGFRTIPPGWPTTDNLQWNGRHDTGSIQNKF